MAKQKKPAIVAELGRPETPEETAARKAEASRLYRKRKTVNNLILSLAVSLGAMFLFVLLVPEGRGDYLERDLDVAQLAQQAEPSAGLTLAQPKVPEEWLAKQAELRFSESDRITHWYIGYNTPEDYAAVMQGYTPDLAPAPETWISERVEKKSPTGSVTVDGVEWIEYDYRDDNPDNTNITYGLVTEREDSTLVVIGTAAPEAVTELARQTYASLEP